MVRLSILICHNPKEAWRVPLLESLLQKLKYQRMDTGESDLVEVIVDNGAGSIGAKRNRLLNGARGLYVQFIDDDDDISKRHIALQLPGIYRGVDCCSLKGIINERGVEKVFIHSLKYKEWDDNGMFYERYPNHLNCIRADIAKQFTFPEINHGEDHSWAKQIHNSGLLKTEYWIDDVMYYYNPSSNRK